MTIENPEVAVEEEIPSLTKEEFETRQREGRRVMSHDLDPALFKGKKEFPVYMKIQLELMQAWTKETYGVGDKADERAIEWVEQYAAEFRTAFDGFLFEHPDAIRLLGEEEKDTTQKIVKRMKLIKEVEKMLCGDTLAMRKVRFPDFIQWRKKHGDTLMEMLLKHPKLIKRFEASEDEHPDIQKKIIEEIKEKLYEEEKSKEPPEADSESQE